MMRFVLVACIATLTGCAAPPRPVSIPVSRYTPTPTLKQMAFIDGHAKDPDHAPVLFSVDSAAMAGPVAGILVHNPRKHAVVRLFISATGDYRVKATPAKGSPVCLFGKAGMTSFAFKPNASPYILTVAPNSQSKALLATLRYGPQTEYDIEATPCDG